MNAHENCFTPVWIIKKNKSGDTDKTSYVLLMIATINKNKNYLLVESTDNLLEVITKNIYWYKDIINYKIKKIFYFYTIIEMFTYINIEKSIFYNFGNGSRIIKQLGIFLYYYKIHSDNGATLKVDAGHVAYPELIDIEVNHRPTPLLSLYTNKGALEIYQLKKNMEVLWCYYH